ncbi:DUF2303 family protein [Caulobacter sp. DWR3-1-2]|uniref:DUF2303 family protein n=1 Tax=Caulobacter sp. DWR3-1-2 TaxID=2804647 RepID=UPI003CEFDAF4
MKEQPNIDTEAGQIAALAMAAYGAKPVSIETGSDREFLLIPDGYTAQDVSEPNRVPKVLPDHIQQAVTLQTLDSLSEYVQRFKTDDTLMVANIATNTIIAVIDYHSAATEAHDPTSQPNHGAHRATLTLPYSVEWQAWTKIDGKLMPQLEFARYLEENAADIIAPLAADLLEACRDIQANRKVNFVKAVRTSSDNENFEYTDETTATSRRGGLELPTQFVLGIPVYFGDSNTELRAFLRWRLDEGQLLLGIALHRAEHVRQAVFKSHVGTVTDRTGRLAVFGLLPS